MQSKILIYNTDGNYSIKPTGTSCLCSFAAGCAKRNKCTVDNTNPFSVTGSAKSTVELELVRGGVRATTSSQIDLSSTQTNYRFLRTHLFQSGFPSRLSLENCLQECLCVCVCGSLEPWFINFPFGQPRQKGKSPPEVLYHTIRFFSRLSSENLEPKKSSPNKRPYKQFSLRSNCDGYLYFSLYWFVAGHCESGVRTGFRIMWGQKNRLETGLDLDTGVVVVVVRDRVHFLSLSISGRFAQDLLIA